jgi:hypothetical protein
MRHRFDLDQLRAEITPRLEAAQLVTDPIPHIIVDDLWPDNLFAAAEHAWPPAEAFYVSKNRQKMNLAPVQTRPEALLGDFGLVPEAHREFWRFVAEDVNRHIIGPWLGRVFADDIRARLDQFKQWQAEGRAIGFDAPGLQSGEWIVTHGRLMLRGHGYVLKPHCDGAWYLVTALHYFSGGRADAHGTIIYRPERPLPVDAFLRDGTTEYFHKNAIPVHEAKRIEFKPNRFMAFPNRLDAAHGVTAPADETYRKVFQFHLSLKDDARSPDY